MRERSAEIGAARLRGGPEVGREPDPRQRLRGVAAGSLRSETRAPLGAPLRFPVSVPPLGRPMTVTASKQRFCDPPEEELA